MCNYFTIFEIIVNKKIKFMNIKTPESLFQLTFQGHEIIVSFNVYREGKRGFHGR